MVSVGQIRYWYINNAYISNCFCFVNFKILKIENDLVSYKYIEDNVINGKSISVIETYSKEICLLCKDYKGKYL